jgi:glycosyltransferase involved in cell wall biosynthesis
LQPLSIVHVSTERAWHGGEEQIRQLCEGLRRRGHHNTLIARADGMFAQRMLADNFDVRLVRGNGRNLSALLTMRRLFKKVRPDVLHFHDGHGLLAGGIASLGLKIPARVAARRVTFPLRSSWKYRKFADCVIAVSQRVVSQCEAAGVPADRLRLVYDGVDPARAQSGCRQKGRQALGLNDNTLMLLTVASLSPPKGHHYLLEAFAQVRQQVSQPLQLMLAGEGTLKPQLQQQAERLGIATDVHFLGYRTDVPDLLHAADLFVLASENEGLCSSLIDAMLAHLPIVATSVGGIPELLGPYETEPALAPLVPPGDVPALAAAMQQVVQEVIAHRNGNQDLTDRIHAAQTRATHNFTADQMVDSTLAVYIEWLSRDGKYR